MLAADGRASLVAMVDAIYHFGFSPDML